MATLTALQRLLKVGAEDEIRKGGSIDAQWFTESPTEAEERKLASELEVEAIASHGEDRARALKAQLAQARTEIATLLEENDRLKRNGC